MSSLPVDMRRVHHTYGKRASLRGVDLRVETGEIVGLVGANGSGKTTLLKILAGFLKPDDGVVQVFGLSPQTAAPAIMQQARFAFAPPALYGNLTAREHLQFLSRLADPEHPLATVTGADIDAVLERVGLAARASDRVRTYSFGMRQRLVLAQALLPRPQLLVLDEPSDGLDPVAVTELRHLLQELRHDWGLSILLSSHLLEEIEHLVDRMLVLSEGQCAFEGAPADLTARFVRTRVQAEPRDAARRILEEQGLPVEDHSDALDIADTTVSLAQLQEWFEPHGVRLHAFHQHRPHLGAALLRTLEQAHAPTGNGRRAAASDDARPQSTPEPPEPRSSRDT